MAAGGPLQFGCHGRRFAAARGWWQGALQPKMAEHSREKAEDKTQRWQGTLDDMTSGGASGLHRLAKPMPIWKATRSHDPEQATRAVAAYWAKVWRTSEIDVEPPPGAKEPSTTYPHHTRDGA